MDVVLIKRHVTDSWNPPPPVCVAVAADEDAAKRWIQDEVDGKHESTHSYMKGKDADWWIKYGTFTLTPATIQT